MAPWIEPAALSHLRMDIFVEPFPQTDNRFDSDRLEERSFNPALMQLSDLLPWLERWIVRFAALSDATDINGNFATEYS